MSNQYDEMEIKTLSLSDTDLVTSTWLSGAVKRPCLAFSVRSGSAHFQVSLTPTEARTLARNLINSAERRELMDSTAVMEAV